MKEKKQREILWKENQPLKLFAVLISFIHVDIVRNPTGSCNHCSPSMLPCENIRVWQFCSWKRIWIDRAKGCSAACRFFLEARSRTLVLKVFKMNYGTPYRRGWTNQFHHCEIVRELHGAERPWGKTRARQHIIAELYLCESVWLRSFLDKYLEAYSYAIILR